jgi:hypothetical protein
MRIWTPAPWDSMKPLRVEVAGRDISAGRRPASVSASELEVAFIDAKP